MAAKYAHVRDYTVTLCYTVLYYTMLYVMLSIRIASDGSPRYVANSTGKGCLSGLWADGVRVCVCGFIHMIP